MTTYDENGGYPHPDHIMCHKVSVAAFDAAGDPEPLPRAGRAVAAAEALLQLRLHQGADARAARGACWPPAWSRRTRSGWRSWEDRAGHAATGSPPGCECGDYFEVRDDALRAHATQVDPDGFWFHVPMELQQQVWPTEDFELARSLVDSPTAGVRPVRRHPGDGPARAEAA